MGYIKADIIKKCEISILNPSNFYTEDMVNYRGKTQDTGEYYTEVIAEFLCENLEKFKSGIKTVNRENYKTKFHNGKINSSNREEENTAKNIFNASKNGESYDFIGKVIDYQTPLKMEAEDTVGKIDLLSYNGDTAFILELKKKDSTETMLRCVLEAYTYLKTVNKENLFRSFDELKSINRICACPFVYKDGKQYEEMEEQRPNLKELMELLAIKPYYITEENKKFTVTEE